MAGVLVRRRGSRGEGLISRVTWKLGTCGEPDEFTRFTFSRRVGRAGVSLISSPPGLSLLSLVNVNVFGRRRRAARLNLVALYPPPVVVASRLYLYYFYSFAILCRACSCCARHLPHAHAHAQQERRREYPCILVF
jgi:hypothetical protein